MNPVQHPRSYAHTYIHTELFSHKIALHTRQPQDLHLSVSGHRNPSIEPVLNPNLSLLSLFTFFFCSAILSFHGNGSPCSRQFGKKTDNGNRQVRENCLVEILVGNPRFGCRFAMKFGFEARKWQRKKGSRKRRGEGGGRSDSMEFIIELAKESSFSRATLLLCLPSFDYPDPPH